MKELLEFFKEYRVPIQITLDPDANPTVHALYKYNGENIHMTTAETLEGALLAMKKEYEKAMVKWNL